MNRIILKDKNNKTIIVVSIGESEFPPEYILDVPPEPHYVPPREAIPQPNFKKRVFWPVSEGPNQLGGIDVTYLERE